MLTRKVIVIGPTGVGKSCIVSQMTTGKFLEDHSPTIQDVFPVQTKVETFAVDLEITDTSSLEENSSLRESRYPYMDAFVAVYSINSKQSFDELQSMIERLYEVKGTRSVPMVLVGNKLDLASEREVMTGDGEELARQLQCFFLEISAKDKERAQNVFMLAIKESGLPEDTVIPENKKKCCFIL